MSLTSKIKTLAVGKAITLTRVRVETKPNGLIELFDIGSKLHLLVDTQGIRRGGSLPLTDAQIRQLTGIQV